ncbi:hypothetical protein ASG43_19010 [Aureimonas sp. Leaf454]|uniref:sensor histidine kinase n=1 Tax=Aureimonas sp. Leaf454 TaxID=1736381 RepID=UPI0006FD0468|nr:histidine kinase dimerization/phosphoacceptor domain -containing protein [Aureimonas sp. Leaf454]KQT53304.1 hypothetical protein ASG43_19010 [Aureimonas sp. Leaf454]
MSFRVIVLDDNPDDRELVLRQVRAEFPGADTLALPDMNGLDEALARGTPGLVVTDLDLRWASGLDILDKVKATTPDCPIVMFTGSGNEEVAVEAMKRGLDDYVVKSPRQMPRLRTSMRQAVERSAARVELRRQQELVARHERQLEEELAQKTVILRELHHRVKNNLQNMTAILRMRSKRAVLPELKAELQEMSLRLTALAQVQSRILDEDQLNRVDFGAVLDETAATLERVYGDGRIRLERDISQPFILPVARAMPLGLICYEVLLNAFKHGFPERASGTVRVSATVGEAGYMILVQDDGTGFEDLPERRGMGMTLVHTLAGEALVRVEQHGASVGGSVTRIVSSD